MSKNKSKNFVEPREFFNELLHCMKDDEISERLGEIFLSIATKYVNHPMFVRYAHIREDLISVAAFACCKSYSKFRPDQNIILERDEDGEVTKTKKVEWDGKIVEYDYNKHYNPLSFFTTTMRNALFQYLKSEYKESNALNAYRVDIGLEADTAYTEMMKEKEERANEAEEAGLIDTDVDEDEDEEYDPEILDSKKPVIVW